MNFKCIIFDLDDTLLDTYKYLIGPALERSFASMTELGLKIQKQNFFQEYKEFMRKDSRRSFFEYLAPEMPELSRAGEKAFYEHNLDIEVKALPGARELLEQLEPKFQLHLVTTGHPETQARKVSRLDIDSFFEKIWYTNSRQGERKKTAFSKIVEEEELSPQEVLCVGNRLDHEIYDANSLGLKTCLLSYGEYQHQKPQNELEKADFMIRQLSELERTCLR